MKIQQVMGLLLTAALTAGCSTTRTFVDYSRSALYSTETAGNVPYVEIGPAVASQRGFVWDDCWALAEKAVDQLRVAAEQRGANGVMAVRWLNHADGTLSDAPMCTTGWGWFVPLIAPGFGPWVKATEVRGRLVRAEDGSLAGLRKAVSRQMADYQQRANTPPADEAPATPAQ